MRQERGVKGDDRAGGRVVSACSPADLRRQFALRRVSFSSRFPRSCRRQLLLQVAGALMDLADVLEFSDPELSAGVLALRLGTAWRAGYGGKAYPRSFTIALSAAGGALAHEWAHFLDVYLGTLAVFGAIGRERAALTQLVRPGEPLPVLAMPEVARAFCAVVAAIHQPTPARRIRAVPESDLTPGRIRALGWERYEALLRRHRWSVDAALQEVAARSPELHLPHLERIGNILAGLAERRGIRVEFFTVPKTRSRFVAGALAQREPRYWAHPAELFARAFAAYVEDRLREEGRRSPFLVGGTVRNPAAPHIEPFVHVRFPEGEERRRIHRALAEFLAFVRESGVMRLSAGAGAEALPEVPGHVEAEERRLRAQPDPSSSPAV